MERRLVLFLVLSFAILVGYSLADAAAASAAAAEADAGPAAAGQRPRSRSRRPAAEKKPPSSRRRETGRKPRSRRSRRSPRRRSSRRAEPETPEQWVTLGSADHERSVPHVGHADQQGGGRGADRVEQPALLRHRRPQRLPGPSGDGFGRARPTAARCRSSAPARPPPRPA